MNRSVLLAMTLLTAPLVAGPKVDVVVGPRAPKLERHAADELAALLGQLVEAEVSIRNEVPAKSSSLILLGSPATNPAVERLVGKRWPKLTAQGHLVRSIVTDDRSALLIGGGSPAATLWAVHELAHHLGQRSTVYGDVRPAKGPTWPVPKIDLVREPVFRQRGWRTLGASPVGLSSWGLADQKRLVDQLAKLKFNRLVLEVDARQPFFAYSFGPEKNPALLWREPRVRVDGDTAGRLAFRGVRFFDNPDLPGDKSDKERLDAGIALARGIIAHARDRGMSPVLALTPLTVEESDERFEQRLRAQILSCVETYPGLDAIELTVPTRRETREVVHRLVTDERLFTRKTGGRVAVLLSGPASGGAQPGGIGQVVALGTSPRRIALSEQLAKTPARTVRSQLLLPLADEGVLPQLATGHLHVILGRLSKLGWEGFSVRGPIPGDQLTSIHYLSRASFDASLTPGDTLKDLVTATCGEGVAERIGKGFEQIEKASDLLDRDGDPARLDLQAMLTADRTKDLPASWKQISKFYAGAMDEMYRGQQRAPGRMRPILVYHAKRLEFALGYVGSVEALHQATKAKADRDKRVEYLEKAIESIYNGLNALGEVARDQSDRGVIAILNARGYRLLKAELERAEK